MNDKKNIKISEDLLECFRTNIKYFMDNFDNEINSEELSAKDLYLILTSAVMNLTIMIFNITYSNEIMALKKEYVRILSKLLLKDEKLND
jgi:hypothetical protein